MLMLLCIMATIAYKEEKPWSNVSTFWNRFVVLKTISKTEALRWSIAHPPRIDFPSTIIPILNASSPRTSSQRPYDLTGNRRKEFLKWLGRPQNESRDILRIGCTSWSESSCVAAGKFLIYFSEAGWPIDSNRVFRMEPQIPFDGMAMATGGEIPESAQNLPPHLGVWEKMDASQVTIWWAFRHMGIPVSSPRDTSLPPKTLGIYFGPEPKP